MANPKGNPQNLKNLAKRPKKERTEIASKGGKKSAANKQKKKVMGEVAKAFLDCDLSEKKKKELTEKFGLPDDTLSNRFPMVYELYRIILDSEEIAPNKIAAMKMLIELAGESPNQIEADKAAQRQKNQIEDDPFSKSIKELFEAESTGEQ